MISFFNTSNIKYLTSEIDWCEDNFVYCDYIAEFWNSLTSLFFVFLGIFGLINMPYYKFIINLLYFNIILIGLSSVLFHSTLSIQGQILDEFTILMHMFFGILYLNRYYINYPILSIISVFLTPVLIYIYPVLNRFFLFLFGFKIYKIALNKKDRIKQIDIKLVDILYKTKRYFIIAFMSWIIDFICFLPISSHFIWHVYVSFTCYLLTFILNCIAYDRDDIYNNNYNIEYLNIYIYKIPYLILKNNKYNKNNENV